MVNKPKAEWFLASQGIKPDSTIVLGKVIADPRYPSGPPKLSTLPIDAEIFTHNHSFSRHDDHGKGGKAGVFLSFLSMLGVGTDTSAELQLNKGTSIDVDKLETSVFEPSSGFVQRVLDLPDNVIELNNRRSRRALYMITGIKVAWGGTITSTSSQSWNTEASVGMSPMAPGVDVGVKGGLNRSKGHSESLGKHDFVYAFKLTRITYARKTGAVLLDPHTRGAAFDHKSQGVSLQYQTETSTEQVESVEKGAGYTVLGIQMKDAGSNEFGVDGVEVDGDDDEPCLDHHVWKTSGYA